MNGQKPTRSGQSAFAPETGRCPAIDIETCCHCGGTVKVIACIEDPVVIEKILTYLNEKAPVAVTIWLPNVRVPPQAGLFDSV